MGYVLISRFFQSLFGSQEQKPSSSKRIPESAKQSQKNHYKKIQVEDPKIGMYVRKLDIAWEQSSFVFQGIDIKSQDDIEDVRRQCIYVWVDYKEDENTSPEEEIDALETPVITEVSLEELEAKYVHARQLHEQTSQTVQRVFDSVANKQAIDLSDIQLAVSNSIDSVLESPDASIWFTRLNEHDDRTAQHSMNVATLSILLGQAMDFSRAGLEELGVCALMHDIGMTLLPSNILHESGSNESHEEALRSHVNIGFNIISESPHFSFGTAKSVLHHHERMDGKGYPHGLKREDIPRNARLIAVTNAYDRLVSGYQGQEPYSQIEAINALYKDCGTHFDDSFVIKFIEVIGLYPPGTIVEMTNGEIGLVLSSTLQKLKPRVLLVLDNAKNAVTQRVVDLSVISKDADENLYQIKTTLPDGAFGIFLRDVERAGLKIV